MNEQSHGYTAIPEVLNITACAYTPPTSTLGTSSTTATNVPGQGGVPGCAYIIASDLGPEALCSNDTAIVAEQLLHSSQRPRAGLHLLAAHT